MTLILASLAVFFVWEFVLSAYPWSIWPWLQPLLVLGGALGFCWPDWRLALAVAGAVYLLHVAVRRATDSPEPQVVRRPTRIPTLP